MLEQIIPSALMVLSIAIILFLIARRIPSSIKNLDKEPQNEPNKPKKEVKQKKESSKTANIKEKIFGFFELVLKKIKVVVLKADAWFMQSLKKIKQKNERSPLTKDDEDEREQKKLKINILKQLRKKKKAPQKNKQTETESGEEASENEENKKQPIMERMNKLRDKLTSSTPKEIKKTKKAKKRAKEREEKKIKKEEAKKPKQPMFPQKKVDLEETKRVMFERQEESLIKKISANPKDDSAYVELGKLYMKAENFEDAKASFKQALKLNRGNVSAKKNLKELAQQMNP